MSRYKAYPEHKDSGVEWIGDVPAHWQMIPIKRIADFFSGSTPDKVNEEYWGGEIPWVSPKDMRSDLITHTKDYMTSAGLESCGTLLQPPGRLLIVARSGILRHRIPVAINNVKTAVNQDIKVIAPREEKCDSYFLFRWIQGLNKQLVTAWVKHVSTVESIEYEYIAATLLPLPPLGGC